MNEMNRKRVSWTISNSYLITLHCDRLGVMYEFAHVLHAMESFLLCMKPTAYLTTFNFQLLSVFAMEDTNGSVHIISGK